MVVGDREPRSQLREHPTPLVPSLFLGAICAQVPIWVPAAVSTPLIAPRQAASGLIPSLFAACQGIKGERGYAGSPGEKGESVSV